MKSIRQEKLSQDAQDIIAWAFIQNVILNDFPFMEVTAMEVKLGGDEVNKILFCENDGTFIKHAGSDAEKYFHHINDEDWAIVTKADLLVTLSEEHKLLIIY